VQIAANLKLLSKAARRYDASPIMLARRALHLHRVHRIGFREALSEGLLNPAIRSKAFIACVSRKELTDHQQRHNRQDFLNLTEDKATFYNFCADTTLPVPRTYAVFDKCPDPTVCRTREEWERFFTNDLPDEFVVKPSRSAHGEGVAIYRKGFAAAALFDAMNDSPRWTRFVIQERVRNHAAITHLSGSETLQTVRLTTWMTPDNRIELPRAFFKIAVGDNITDNYNFGAAGNLKANLDPTTGKLAKAIQASSGGIGFSELSIHPGTGKQISGFQIPDWPAVMALAEQAARIFLPLRTVGWDIAVTPEGPVLIEGNPFWDPSNDLVVGPQPSRSSLAQVIEVMRRFLATPSVPNIDSP
jgi:hypothetical protein